MTSQSQPFCCLEEASAVENPYRHKRRWQMDPYRRALFLLLSLSTMLPFFMYDRIVLRNSKLLYDPKNSPYSIIRDPSWNATVRTFDEIFLMQDVANKRIPRQLKDTQHANDDGNRNGAHMLPKIENEFEHDDPTQEQKPKPEQERPSKFMVLHIGPPGTGATSFQKETAHDPGMVAALQKDKVLFVGEHSPDVISDDFQTQKECTQSHVETKYYQELLEGGDYPFVDMPLPPLLRQCTTDKCLAECWSSLETDNEEETNMNAKLQLFPNMLQFNGLIQSDEEVSWNNEAPFHRRFNYEETGMWIDHLKYSEIIAMVTYRRYYSWILEIYHEFLSGHCLSDPDPTALQDLLKQGKLADSGRFDQKTFYWKEFDTIRRNSLWPKHGGQNCPSAWEFIVPYIFRKKNIYGARAFDNIDETVPIMKEVLNTNSEKPYGRVAILNYYQTQDDFNSITEEVYCNVLGVDKTPHACKYARKNLGPKGRRVSLVNRNLLYDQIVMAAHEKGWVGKRKDKEDLKVLQFSEEKFSEEKFSEENFSEYLESFPFETERIRLRRELMEHHTNTHQKSVLNLPFVCPLEKELNKLLKKSLEFEELVMPDFYNTSNGKDAHIKEFWADHESERTFCSVDIEQLFEGAHSWDDILTKSLAKSWQFPRREKTTRVWVEKGVLMRSKSRHRW